MLNGLVTTEHVSFLVVFIEGILSFFSPCVLPLIPVYIGYLAGNGKETSKEGEIMYPRKKVFFHTLCFIVGISFAFFILGMSFSALGAFFQSNKMLFSRIGGILIILLGLFQLGVFQLNFLQREQKIHLNLAQKQVNPLIAFVMGFTFSFAWTPCVGPALSSVLIMASGAKSSGVGNLLVLVYAAGFVIPFLFLGLFTTQVLNFLRKRRNLLKYTIKAAGVLLILIGFMTFTGWMNGITGYLTSFGQPVQQEETTENNKPAEETGTAAGESNSVTKDKEEKEIIPAFDFTLTDQYGTEHTLSDYKGKVVFLNFWATWCGPCKKEMPHIEELYKEYNLNKDEVVILGIANPRTKEYPHNQDVEKEEIIEILEKEKYTFPVVFDETGEVFSDYFISSFPTTYMIDKKGNIYGYVSGTLERSHMESIISQTLEASKEKN